MRIYTAELSVELFEDEPSVPWSEDKIDVRTPVQYVKIEIPRYIVNCLHLQWNDDQKADFVTAATADFRRHVTQAVGRVQTSHERNANVLEEHRQALSMLKYIDNSDCKSLSALMRRLEDDVERIESITRR